MELLSPLPDEAPQQPPQDAGTDGPSQDCAILRAVTVAAHDMAEWLSSSLLTKHSGFFGLRLGQGFDMVYGVDLCTVLGSALVRAYMKAHRPWCVVVSQPCTTFSRPMAICRGRMPPGRYDHNYMYGNILLSCAMPLCKFQHVHSRYSYISIPRKPHIGNTTSVLEVMSLLGDTTSRLDQCCYGLTAPYEGNQSEKAHTFLFALRTGHPRRVRRPLRYLSRPPSKNKRIY